MPTSERIDAGANFQRFFEGVSGTGQLSNEALGGCIEATEGDGKKLDVGVHQAWPDGSRYEGEIVSGLKQGEGVFTWENGELYEGSFYKDYRHGIGTYTWPEGSRFHGKFYRNRKEGYGIQHFPDGTTFQGLYHADERFGPGVLTYPDGRQDVGLWHRDRLLRLCTRVPGAFCLRAHPEYSACTPPRVSGHRPGSEPSSGGPAEPAFSPCPGLFVPSPQIEAYSTDSDHLALPLHLHRELDRRFFSGRDGDPNMDPAAFESLPLQLRMQAHIHRHRFEAEEQDWAVAAVTSGNREHFGPQGPLERVSERLIQEASRGDRQSVYRILREGAGHPDVGDATEHTALIAATVNCHTDVIHLLLDSGADVNKLNGEGMSALAVCSILYYPYDSLHETLAETPPQRPFPHSQESNTQSPLEDAPQRNGPEEGNVEENGQSDETNPPDQSGQINYSDCPDRYDPSPETPQPLTRSIPVLDGDVLVGSVSWPENRAGEVVPEEEVELSDSTFDSARSQSSLPIHVSDEVIQQTAEALSRTGLSQPTDTQETVWKMVHMKTTRRARWSTMALLLSRGANPNASSVPMPVLLLAIKARDVQAVRRLLECGARTDVPLPPERKGLYPLHIAAGLPGPEGPKITELLLHALADPNVRALDAHEVFELDRSTPEPQSVRGSKTPSSSRSPPVQHYTPLCDPPDEGGRTPLHVACQRDAEYARARDVVSLLLSHKANTNLLWSGHSPLSLAIASGNNLAVDELLAWGADPNLSLTRQVGSALCTVANISYDCRQHPRDRVKLLEKLVNAGANILMPVTYGEGRKTAVGTAVDYAHYVFQQDRRIAHTPYHALSTREREVYNARRHLLAQMGELLRQAAVQVERQRMEAELRLGVPSVSPSDKFLYIGAGATLPQAEPSGSINPDYQEATPPLEPRKPLFEYCYQCGRSAGVALAACSRCRQVFYCSKACKMKAWSDRHKDECIRLSGKARDRKCSVKKSGAQEAEAPQQGSARAPGRIQTAPWTPGKEPKDSWELEENYSFN
ncbi:ankyrin repeat and MYND domain-containing protein 1 [Anguilla anguilla]|uniref:ankyrin repeat and MYND domain-containing protein 1 n=1 Tax=Anguilla anguilla TaxID=7936 RepID=UPI0015B0366A|nr:ankyrin repeat and MYND domain-containing protein 1 [Anguilla anguilla]